MSIEGAKQVLRQGYCALVLPQCADCVSDSVFGCKRSDGDVPLRCNGGLDATSRAKLEAYIEREEAKMRAPTQELWATLTQRYWERQDMSRDEGLALLDDFARKVREQCADAASEYLNGLKTREDCTHDGLRAAILAPEED